MKVIKPQLVKIKNPNTGEFENLNGYVKGQGDITVDQEINNRFSKNPVSADAVRNYVTKYSEANTQSIDYLFNLLCNTKIAYNKEYNMSNDNNLYKTADGKYIYYDNREKKYNTDRSIISIKIDIHDIVHIKFNSNNIRCPYVILDKNDNVLDTIFDQSIISGTSDTKIYDIYNNGNSYYLVINQIPNYDNYNCTVYYSKSAEEKVKKSYVDQIDSELMELESNLNHDTYVKLEKILYDYYNYKSSTTIEKISNGYYYINGKKITQDSSDYDNTLDSYTIDLSSCTFVNIMYDHQYPYVFLNENKEVVEIQYDEYKQKGHFTNEKIFFGDTFERDKKRYIVVNYYKDEEYPLQPKIGLMASLISKDDIENIKLIPELKKSVSDGKALLAGAITDKGVDTASDDSFETMAYNIKLIDTESNKEYKYSYASNTSVAVCDLQDIKIDITCIDSANS